MQDPRLPASDEIQNLMPRKKKSSSHKPLFNDNQEVQQVHVHGSLPLQTGKKASKKKVRKEASPVFQQPERSNSDSLPDSSTSGDEYRTLRRKYLLLEEESFALGRELKEVEDEVDTLEDEKLALLDKLVVLEGLVNPSHMQSR